MHQFDRDIAVQEVKADVYAGTVVPNWSINGVPNGGYLMGIVANALLQASRMTATPIVTANFLARCEPGEATVTTERMSLSKQFDRFEVKLLQQGREKIRAFGTFANEHNECVLESYQAADPELADRWIVPDSGS